MPHNMEQIIHVDCITCDMWHLHPMLLTTICCCIFFSWNTSVMVLILLI